MDTSETSRAASYFMGISAKIVASKQSNDGGVGNKVRDEEPRQPVGPHPIPPPPPPHGHDGRGCQQVSGMLTTQVRQLPPMAHHKESMNSAAHTTRGGGDGNGREERNRRENGDEANAMSHSGSHSNDRNSNNSVVARQKVHASALVARSRRIRGRPKNTSPIDASMHPALLPPQMPQYKSKKTLVLDLDETLVHSSLSYQPKTYDLMLQVPVNNSNTTVYVAFRPYLHEFFRAIAPLFEIVVFTASVSIYCNPLMNFIDPERILGSLRLYREHCSMVNGAYVKDLSLLGRDLDNVAIVDNSPVTYLFQQRNAIPITSWFEDPSDEELKRLIPVLEALAEAPNVYEVLDNYNAILQLQQEQTTL